jgi:hypothetical protein
MCGRVNARLTWIRPSAGSFWLNQPIPGPHVPSTDLPESSDLGLSFSEPLAEQAKELRTLSGALHGHHLERFTFSSGALCYIAVTTTGPLSLEHGNWANGLCVCHPRQGPVFGVRCEGCTVPWVQSLLTAHSSNLSFHVDSSTVVPSSDRRLASSLTTCVGLDLQVLELYHSHPESMLPIASNLIKRGHRRGKVWFFPTSKVQQNGAYH